MPAWQFVSNQTLKPANLVGKSSGWAARILHGISLFLKEKKKEKEEEVEEDEDGGDGGSTEDNESGFRGGHGGTHLWF